jgi:hypothetical protein
MGMQKVLEQLLIDIQIDAPHDIVQPNKEVPKRVTKLQLGDKLFDVL